jgi:hypothetical protein
VLKPSCSSNAIWRKEENLEVFIKAWLLTKNTCGRSHLPGRHLTANPNAYLIVGLQVVLVNERVRYKYT